MSSPCSSCYKLLMLVLGLVLLVASRAPADIIFTPSSEILRVPWPLPEQVVNINFDGLDLPEFRLLSQWLDVCVCLPGDPPPPFWALGVDDAPGGSNQMHVVDSPEHEMFPPESLTLNSPIDSSRSYGSTDGDMLFSVSLATGQPRGIFYFPGEHYVGVTFQIGIETFFGWIGFHVLPSFPLNEVRLLGYAYDNAGGPIRAGQIVPDPSADFDEDGDIDGRDFLAWQRGYGIATGATLSQGDSDHNGAVDGADLGVWQSTYGNNSLMAATSLPEPGGLALASLLGGSLLGWRKKN